jgi:hypothetical protein
MPKNDQTYHERLMQKLFEAKKFGNRIIVWVVIPYLEKELIMLQNLQK